ncbi:LuxR C-terminal-related transcriptional regulator [Nocardia amikacinitolerans]|uniref:helix-turn-helix transcriptional regulator n=1 Tax=Nocardia amikacinitolerans TaxID=756689 RepID=UPI0020A4FCAA|nr:LuxR C-terminal-related transcriptional regulator [Nocardia amikacinitolerans]
MPSARDLLDRVERHCRADQTAKRLREVVLADLRAAVSFDGYVFMLTDPATRVGTSPLADLLGLPWSRLPELIRLRYLTEFTRWSDLLDRSTAATSLRTATGGDPARSRVWREVLRDLGVFDTATVVFGDRYGCWGFLELLRKTPRAFDPTQLTTLAALAAPITRGLRAALGRTFVAEAGGLVPAEPAVLTLGPDLRMRGQTPAAAAGLLRLNPPHEAMPPIPNSVYNVGAALLAAEHGTPVGPPRSRVHLGGARWLTVRADRLGDQDITVSMAPSTPAERLDLFGRAHALTPRENEVLTLLATGRESRRPASDSGLPEQAINDHVKAILAKCGVHTRQGLLSRALGIT